MPEKFRGEWFTLIQTKNLWNPVSVTHPQQTPDHRGRPTKPGRHIAFLQPTSDASGIIPSPEFDNIPHDALAPEPQQIRCFPTKSAAIPRFAASMKTSSISSRWQWLSNTEKNNRRHLFRFLALSVPHIPYP